MHWDGHGWRQIPRHGSLFGLGVNATAVLSTSDIWAVGPNSLVADRWDGHRWGAVSIAPAG